MQGRILQELTGTSAEGINEIPLHIQQFKPAMYLVTLTINESEYHSRFVKE